MTQTRRVLECKEVRAREDYVCYRCNNLILVGCLYERKVFLYKGLDWVYVERTHIDPMCPPDFEDFDEKEDVTTDSEALADNDNGAHEESVAA